MDANHQSHTTAREDTTTIDVRLIDLLLVLEPIAFNKR